MNSSRFQSVLKAIPRPWKVFVKRIIFRDWITVIRCFPRRLLNNNQVSLNFAPEDPRSRGLPYMPLRIADHLGFSLNNPKAVNQVHFHWHDKTHTFRLKEVETSWINSNCLDISKKNVDRVFEEVFGYSITVDPLTYHGTCVEKSDENGRHDGRLVDCPLRAARTDCVYQKFIDTRVDEEYVDQLRLPVFGYDIPFIWIKFKKADNPFAVSERGIWKETSDCLNHEEVRKVLEFCEAMGLDYGELDVLRDRIDGKIYIVDTNKTPTYHLNGYSRKDREELMRRMCHSFQEAFLPDVVLVDSEPRRTRDRLTVIVKND